MTKSEYLSNSAKLLLMGSVLLFAVNLFAFLGDYIVGFSTISTKLSNFTFYAVLVVGFLAFNGEGIAYKNSRETQKKSKTVILKVLLIFAFFVRFVKTFVENALLSADAESVVGIFSRLISGVFVTVSSYGFLFAVVSLWYIFRDSDEKKLCIVEICAFAFGVIYNVYKVFYYTVSKYGVTAFGELFTNLFSDKTLLNIFCLLQFVFDIIMFAVVKSFYDKKIPDEQDEKKKIARKMLRAKNIYSTDGCGIDTLEDDYFTDC